MSGRSVMAGMGLAVALAVSLSGCGIKLSGKVMCEAHAGTYNAQSKQCTYPPQPQARSATQICQAQGGQWDDVSGMCALNQSSK
jgi:hypothetical protein